MERKILSHNQIRLARGVVVEQVGAELVVLPPEAKDVVRLHGPAAAIVADLQAGRPVEATCPELESLMSVGIVARPGISRRGLISSGAIGLGAGVAVLALPQAAVATSASLPTPALAPENGVVGYRTIDSSRDNAIRKIVLNTDQINYDSSLTYEVSLNNSVWYAVDDLQFVGDGEILTSGDYLGPTDPDTSSNLDIFLRTRQGSLVSPDVAAALGTPG